MTVKFKNILIIADIEGSSGCWSYEASSFKTKEWAKACVDMSLDVNAVVTALFDAGAENITVKDFHRTAYNLLPELIDNRAIISQGYETGPVPGIGDTGSAEALIMMGMHAAAGSRGFIAHTLSYREIGKLEVNGKPLAEAQLFSSSVAPFGVKPIFFSGCPVACDQAEAAIPNIITVPIDKTGEEDSFDKIKWRENLSKGAAASLTNESTEIYNPEGPFNAIITFKKGEKKARKLAKRWGLKYKKDQVFLDADNYENLYRDLILLAYFSPLLNKIMPFALSLFNMMGRHGLRWVRRKTAVKTEV